MKNILVFYLIWKINKLFQTNKKFIREIAIFWNVQKVVKRKQQILGKHL